LLGFVFLREKSAEQPEVFRGDILLGFQGFRPLIDISRCYCLFNGFDVTGLLD
jgi:hypothetical protein